jgi:hypothetical protein
MQKAPFELLRGDLSDQDPIESDMLPGSEQANWGRGKNARADRYAQKIRSSE